MYLKSRQVATKLFLNCSRTSAKVEPIMDFQSIEMIGCLPKCSSTERLEVLRTNYSIPTNYLLTKGSVVVINCCRKVFLGVMEVFEIWRLKTMKLTKLAIFFDSAFDIDTDLEKSLHHSHETRLSKPPWICK